MWGVSIYFFWTFFVWISSTFPVVAAGPGYYQFSASHHQEYTASTYALDTEPQMRSLNLWIEGKEIVQFVGVPMDIYVIREGVVVPYLQDAYIDNKLPVLPPEVHVVKLTWQATDDLYQYQFKDLRSLDPHTLYNPLISIPTAGYIPRLRQEFQITIPCTRQVTAIASMYISLQIINSRARPIPGSPIKLHLRKRCIAYDERTLCRFECKNEGHCNSQGYCECKPGYLGQQCQQVVCLPECQNNGTCISPRKCECTKGFTGEHCEIPVCRRPCHQGGTCVGPDKCDCPNGYYGNFCQHKSGLCQIPCKNGGTCSEANRCLCRTGYTGKFCQKAVCKQNCGVHGMCIDHNLCGCKRGWRGRFCHKTVNRPARDHRARKKRRKEEQGQWLNRRQRKRRTRKKDRRRQQLKERRSL